MLLIFMILLGSAAVLIQFVSFKQAFTSANYWHLKKAALDLSADTVVFFIALTGGVIGFYIAVVSSFLITVYLNYFAKGNYNRPEPRWYVYLKILGRKLNGKI